MSIGGLLGQALLGGTASAADGITKRQAEQRTLDARKEETMIGYQRALATDAIRNKYAVDNQKLQQDFQSSENKLNRDSQLEAARISASNRQMRMDPMQKARIEAVSAKIEAAIKAGETNTPEYKSWVEQQNQLLGMSGGAFNANTYDPELVGQLTGGGAKLPGEAKSNAKTSGASSPAMTSADIESQYTAKKGLLNQAITSRAELQKKNEEYGAIESNVLRYLRTPEEARSYSDYNAAKSELKRIIDAKGAYPESIVAQARRRYEQLLNGTLR